MKVIDVRNVNHAIIEGMRFLFEEGVTRDSRNGPVFLADGPVTTVYQKPTERVMFWPTRDANPFFHFMESLWMIGGRNDVDFVAKYASNMRSFSDDGVTLHGAYGFRWRNHFGGDQLSVIADLLRKNKDDRRIVLQMWDPISDLAQDGKDFPCNTQIFFRISVYGALDMTVVNRSNDIIWGAYGANAVHMSMLQEFMAGWIGVPVGKYWQIANNYHGYHTTMFKHQDVSNEDCSCDPYLVGAVEPYPMIDCDINTWQDDLAIFLDQGPIVGFRSRFFRRVVTPIYHSFEAHKAGDKNQAMEILNNCHAEDWKIACQEWIKRRNS